MDQIPIHWANLALPPLPETADGIRLKIDRANKHIGDLNVVLNSFYNTKPYAVRRNIDVDTGEHVFRITRVDAIPEDVPLIIGDALQNLRSALDHLVCRLFQIRHPYVGRIPKRFAFPIARDADHYSAPEIQGKIEGINPEAIRRINGTKPYKGGNDFLWRLNELNNTDKHRLIISMVSGAAQGRSATLEDVGRMARRHPNVDPDFFTIVDWTDAGLNRKPLKVGDELYRSAAPVPVKAETNMQFKIQVSFDEPGIIEGEPVFDTLWHTSDVVEKICRSFADLL